MKVKLNYCLTLVFALIMQCALAQNQTITGTVTDNNGMPLPGVGIVVEGTETGVVTDFNGKYSIEAASGSVLTYSFMGFETVKKTVGASTEINVEMSPSSELLGKVVITGAMGIQKTADAVTSAQKVVSSEKLTQGRNPNAVAALNGKVTGLVIQNTNSGVTSSNTITLRGMRSITGNNEALIVIDNAISDAATLSTLPPAIIKSINVIKGAQGAALYGSDGVNGVIIVTTEKGTGSDKLRVEYNGSVEFESVAFVPDRQNRYGQGWYNARNQYENGAWGPAFDGSMTAIGLPMYDYDGDGKITLDGIGFGSGTYQTGDNPAAMVGPYEAGKNYVKDFFENSPTISNGVTLSAGDKDQYVLLNLNRVAKDFVIKNDRSKKTSVMFKGGLTAGKFTIDGQINYIRTDAHQSPIMFDESAQQDPIYWHLLQAAPGVPITDYEKYPDNAYAWNAYYLNPYWRIKHVRENIQSDMFSFNAGLGYEINDHINVTYRGNLRTRKTASESHRDAFATDQYIGPAAAAISPISSAYFIEQRDWWDFYGNLMVNLNYDLTEDIGLSANIGHNYQETRYKIMQNGGTNLEVEGVYNMTNVTQPLPSSDLANNSYRRNSNAVFANVDLSYKDYLFLNATARNEWSSTLADDNNSYFYPSVGVSFVPTKAWEFGGDILSYMKVSGNWTRVGNTSSVSWYSINRLTQLGSGFPFNGNNSYMNDVSPANQDIKPEFMTTKEVNLGLGFFNDRIYLNSSIYQTDTKDMITNQTVSSSSGLSNQLVNIGKMRTKGIEVSLSATPILTTDWKWDINLGYSYHESRVLKVTDDANEVALVTLGSIFGVFAQEGALFPLIKTSMMQRDDQGRIIIDPNTGNPLVTSDLKNAGVAVPKGIYNFGTSVSYKGFTLSAVADLRVGNKFIAYVKNGMAFNGTLLESGQLDRENGGFIMPNSVIPDGNGGYIPNTTVKTGGNDYNAVNDYYSSFYGDVGENYLTDGRAFKLREVSLSYAFPTEMVSSIGLRGVTLGVYARNPFEDFASDNQNFADPETSYFGGNARGIAYPGQYPSTRVYGFSLNVKY